MLALYNLGLRLYYFAVYVASFFNSKAKTWIEGRKNQRLIKTANSIWFHFASLGEFEQGRPVLEKMRTLNPHQKIVVTFFSPSGYQIRKNTPLADYVYYLPLDSAANARAFIDTINPTLAIFTKYEYWYHYFTEVHRRNIPLYVISGIFRPGQVFFKWYGGLHRQMLRFVTHFFLQDGQSQQLLAETGVTNCTISGDTRFDRVWANAQNPKPLPLITAFKNSHKVFIAGSTWPPDEHLIAKLVSNYPDWKFIIAPHEIGEEKVNNLVNLFPADKTIKYSQLENSSLPITIGTIDHPPLAILVIDNIGMLSSLYQYGNIAYIGGGFGVGIHNTLEAAAFGLPVIFGPEYAKFKEAKDLISIKAGFSISDEAELKQIVERLIIDVEFCSDASERVKRYVEGHTGATKTIIDFIAPGI